MDDPDELARLTAALQAAGCVAAEDEALELLAATAGDRTSLAALLERRVAGEPLAWLTGSVCFCGHEVLVDPGVYVPRWQTEPLARRAAARLPNDGIAVDLCTGAGAIAVALQAARPAARVIGTDLDERAVDCARRNGVEVFSGDLAAPLPASLRGQVHVVTAVCPYVPTGAIALLPRDVVTYEPRLALDGGVDGIGVLVRAATESTDLLRRGGALLFELGGEEFDLLRPLLHGLGYRHITSHLDEDGDLRAVDATWMGSTTN